MPSYKLENSIPFGAAILTSGKDAPQFKFGLFSVLAEFTELTRVQIPTGKKWPVLNCKILTQNIQTGQHLLQGTTFHSKLGRAIFRERGKKVQVEFTNVLLKSYSFLWVCEINTCTKEVCALWPYPEHTTGKGAYLKDIRVIL